MSSKIASFHIVGPESTPAYAPTREAMKRSHPDIAVHQSNDLAEALALPATAGLELLVLLAPDPRDIDKAAAALDGRGLARWAVIVHGLESGGTTLPVFGVSAADWTVPVLVHTFKFAADLHRLERENARLRGDLRTISRRLAHDLRTPLNCISTAGEALRDPTAADAETSALFVQSITDSVDEVVALLERASHILKATASPVPLQPVAMEEIVWGTLQRLETRILKAQATITKPATWPAVEGVPAWIDLIWVNLLLNSLQHAGARPRIELGWESAGPEVRFWLRDSGRGIAVEKRSRLFHPFDRLSDLNAPRGLGLPIVQRLVELQGGRCGFDPEPAPGGTFFFTLRPSV
jgi:signal transduction histidine kinase